MPNLERPHRPKAESTDPRQSLPTDLRLEWLLLMVLAVGLCLFYLGIELYLLSGEIGFPLDDSWIHLQFARNLAAGNGLSLNPGELVPGSTAPLWTALVSLFFLIPGSPLIWVKIAGVLLYLAGGYLTYLMAVELELDDRMAILAAGLTLATSWLVWSALSGLEIPFFVVVSLWGILLHLRERRDRSRRPFSIALFALGCLARPEGFLLWLLAVVDRFLTIHSDGKGLLRRYRPSLSWLLVAVGLFAILIAPVLLFNSWVSGSVLPTTFGAKSQGLVRWLPEMGYLYTVIGILFQAQPWMTLFAGAGVLVLLGRWGSDRDHGLLPALWLLGLPAAYGLIDPPGQFNLVGNFGRYFFPLFPILVVLGVLGIQVSVAGFAGRLQGGRGPFLLRVALIVLLVVPTLVESVQGGTRYGQSVVNVQDSDVRVARWLAGRVSPDALLAVADIGAIKFLLPNRVIDLAAIANPEVRIWGAERFVEHYQPDYLIVFPSWYQRLFPEGGPFELVRSFPIEDNITMGGDVLAVYSTPWTRYSLAEPPTGGPDG